MNKSDLSERDICTKFITPAIERAGWDVQTQVREEVTFTAGRVIVRGKLVSRGKSKRADYVLSYKPNIPLAVVEAKDNNGPVGGGLQQALGYAEALDVPFAFSSNGDGFVEHDRTGNAQQPERTLSLDQFPSPDELWQRYCGAKGISGPAEKIVSQDYYTDGSGKAPRYYQLNAINRAVEAVAKGQKRIVLVMATGTGKTYTAFQIIWRLWKAGVKKRILFLADRNILVDQTKTNDFKPFAGAMTKITNRKVDKSFEIYLALYQAITGTEESKDIFKEFSPDFFDLIIVDECHRGSAADNSAWREILEYFEPATQLGLTATPKETADVSTTHYFGEPVYTYSLKQGIEDGFLAPYKVVRYDLDRDLEGWRPPQGKLDKHGNEIADRIYNQKDFDRTLVLEKRTDLVAKKVTEFLKATDRFAKTIIFCEDIDHAERMRQALVNENADLAGQNRKYVMRITGDNPEGKAELDQFIHPEERYPVLVTTSKLLSTGVDAQTCKVIVLDQTCRLDSEVVEMLPVAIPPLAEQERIVGKVNQLLGLIDELEAKQAKKRDAQSRFRASALDALAKAEEPDVLASAWKRVAGNVSVLFEKVEDVEALRATIREAACSGSFASLRGRSDQGGTADALLNAIATERRQARQQWLQQGVRRSALPPEERFAFPPDGAFSVPPSWTVCGIDDLLECVPNALKAGPFGSALTKSMHVPTGYKVYGQEQVIPGDHRIGSYYVDKAKFDSLKTCAVAPGDMLISLKGTVGRVLILPPDAEAGIINPRLLKLTLSRRVSADYIKLYLQAPQARRFIEGAARGVAMDGLNIGILRALPIRLPPLAEQKRIVGKVEALMKRCDDLEAKLKAKEETAGRLVEAVVKELVA